MTYLTSSLIALLVGPLVYGAVRRRDMMLSMLDGFIFVTITGLVFIYILPDCFSYGGWLTLLFAIVGLFGPTLLEGFFRRSARRTHIVTLILGLLGVGLHAFLDGTALAHHHFFLGESSEHLLPLAVILHRLPVGLTVWWLLRPSFGRRTAGSVLGLIALSTVVGFALGPALTSGINSEGVAWFQALVAGSLLHVVFHQPHLTQGKGCGCGQSAQGNNWFEGIGALIGLTLTAVLAHGGTLLHAGEAITASASTFWMLARASAPALLIAYTVSGFMNSFMPQSSIGWMASGSTWSQALKGMAVGLPIPVCSCGVVPIYRTLIQRGAPATAGMAFLVATPELGLDAVLLSIPLLGVEMTVLRIAGAAVVALLIGSLVGSKTQPSRPTLPIGEDGSKHAPKSFGQRVKGGLRVGLEEVVDHTAPWIVVGLAVAAVSQPMLSSGWLAKIPTALEIPLFALLGLPAYVCASGATPLVAVLIASGTSPGAALAFLLTGPATNVTTFGILGQLHGKRVALGFSLTMIGLSVGLGFLVNLVFPTIKGARLDQVAAEETSLFQVISVVLVAALYLFSVLRRGPRRFVAELFFQDQRALDLHPHYH